MSMYNETDAVMYVMCKYCCSRCDETVEQRQYEVLPTWALPRPSILPPNWHRLDYELVCPKHEIVVRELVEHEVSDS